MGMRWWMKLYNEILDDPKIARMSDGLFRAFVMLLAAANEAGEAGRLPELDDLAWRVRVPKDELEGHLQSLEAIQSAHLDNEGRWWLSNFARRQAPETPAERQATRRKRVTKRDSFVTGNVTHVESEIESESESKTMAAKPPRQRDELFDAIASICQVDPATTGASIGKVKAKLLTAKPPYTPAEVEAFGKWWWGDKGMRQRPPTVWQLQEQIGVVRQSRPTADGKMTDKQWLEGLRAGTLPPEPEPFIPPNMRGG
jgi:hypothetical protein